MSKCFFGKKRLSPLSNLFVAYEDLARDTVGQLRAVMGFVGVLLDASQLHWRSGEHRDIHGNVMSLGCRSKSVWIGNGQLSFLCLRNDSFVSGQYLFA